jgi:succinate-semialdehyde dehydrogenase
MVESALPILILLCYMGGAVAVVLATAGGSFTNGFEPTTTLGCGSLGGNSISENLDYKHLMNVSRIGKVIANKKVPTDEEIFA